MDFYGFDKNCEKNSQRLFCVVFAVKLCVIFRTSARDSSRNVSTLLSCRFPAPTIFFSFCQSSARIAAQLAPFSLCVFDLMCITVDVCFLNLVSLICIYDVFAACCVSEWGASCDNAGFGFSCGICAAPRPDPNLSQFQKINMKLKYLLCNVMLAIHY